MLCMVYYKTADDVFETSDLDECKCVVASYELPRNAMEKLPRNDIEKLPRNTAGDKLLRKRKDDEAPRNQERGEVPRQRNSP